MAPEGTGGKEAVGLSGGPRRHFFQNDCFSENFAEGNIPVKGVNVEEEGGEYFSQKQADKQANKQTPQI